MSIESMQSLYAILSDSCANATLVEKDLVVVQCKSRRVGVSRRSKRRYRLFSLRQFGPIVSYQICTFLWNHIPELDADGLSNPPLTGSLDSFLHR